MVETVTHRVSCGLLVRNGQVLLVHRSPRKTWYPNVWDLPGGHLERGETYIEALTREMKEELNVEIEPPVNDAHLVLRREGLILKAWEVKSWSGRVENASPDEHDDFGWFELHEAMQLDLADTEYRALFGQVLR